MDGCHVGMQRESRMCRTDVHVVELLTQLSFVVVEEVNLVVPRDEQINETWRGPTKSKVGLAALGHVPPWLLACPDSPSDPWRRPRASKSLA